MAKNWTVACKLCGDMFSYSDHTVQKNNKRLGHTNPEYCDKCRQKHGRIKKTFGMKYFHRSPRMVGALSAFDCSGASVFHPERKHVPEITPQTFDPKKFGVTEGQVREVFQWFKDPRHQVAILIAETGAGKSTAMPFSLVYPPKGEQEGLFTDNGTIVVTQPRIEAASGVAKYVAELIGCHVGKGQMVGVRHSKSRDTADFNNVILYATEGSVLNYLKQGQLAQISTLIIDEAHERSLNIDVILRLIKRRLKQFPHLKVIVTSATIDAEMFQEFFGAHTTTVIYLSGEKRKFKIIQQFADESEKIPYDNMFRLRRSVIDRAMKKSQDLFHGMRKGEVRKGYVLVFLYSIKSIKKAVEEMTEFFESDAFFAGKAIALPLHSKMSRSEQEKAVQATPHKEYKVVFSTNLAETSLTIDRLVHVIDTGLINENQWDQKTQMEMIVPVLHSKSGCRQRWGRVGRKEDGYAYCLYTEEQFNTLFPEHTTPEIQRSNLQPVSLSLKSAGIAGTHGDDWLAVPDESEAQRSDLVLMQQGFVDGDGDITTHGDTLMRFMDAMNIAPLITAAVRYGCAVEMASVLPVLSFGGKRDVLLWDRQWDVYQKFTVRNRHQYLMYGCVDDVDFVLRLAKAFSAVEQEEQRKKLAEFFYVNYEVVKDIFQDRDVILQKLQSGMRDLGSDNIRAIDFTLADVVRIIFAFYLPVYRKYSFVEDYHFQVSGTMEDEDFCISYIKCYERWIEGLPMVCELSSPFVALAQYTFDAKKRMSKFVVTSNHEIADDMAQHATDKTQLDFLVHQIGVPKITAQFTNKIEGGEYQGTYYSGVSRIETKSLDIFHVGEIYTWHIIQVINFPLDLQSALVIKDKTHGITALLSSSEMSFTPSGVCMAMHVRSAVVQKERGFQSIDAEMCGFDEEGYPHFSRLRLIEKNLHDHFEKWSEEGACSMQTGRIVEIRENGYLVILLDVSDVEKMYFHIVAAHQRTYPGEASDYMLGELCNVSIYAQSTKKSFVMLTQGGAEVKEMIKKGHLSDAFSVEGNKLSFVGWMTHTVLDRTKKKLSGIVSGEILDELYRFTNQISAKEVIGVEKLKKLKEKYPDGTIINGATIVDVFPFGVRVAIEDIVFGVVHAREIYGYIDDCTQLFAKGSLVNVRILHYDMLKNQFSLSMKVAGNHDPYAAFQIGEVYDGVVSVVQEKGLVVRLNECVRGFVPPQEMYGWIEHASMVASEGEEVLVRVKSIDKESDRMSLSMKLPTYNIFDDFDVDEEYSGVITKIESYGLRVRIRNRIYGLVHITNIYGRSVERFSVGQSVDVLMINIDAEGGKVELSMLLPQYDPLENIEVGEVYSGVVTGSRDKLGWFVEIAPGVSGLLHISNAGCYVADVDDIAEIGDTIQVEILAITDDRKIQLALC